MPLSHRRVLQAAGIAAGTIAAPKLMPGVAKAADAMVPTLKQSLNAYPPPGDPLKALLERNETFSKAWQALGDDISPQERMALKASMLEQGCQNDRLALDEGQHPWAALISGADARVAPEWIFAACSGELFQVRVAGNSTFDDGIASLAYAVAVLEVPLILASGHSGCGAVKAAMVTKLLTPLLEDLAKPIRSSLKSSDDLTQAIEGKAHYAAGQLTKRSAVPKEARSSGKVMIKSAFFDIKSGKASLLD